MDACEDASQYLRALERLSYRLMQIVAHDFAGLSAAQLSWQVQPERWSIGACLAHLNASLSTYLPLLEALLAKPPKTASHKGFQPGWFGGFFVESVRLNEAGKPLRKLPAPKRFRPDSRKPFEPTVVQEFLSLQKRLIQLIEAFKPYCLETNRIPLPLFPLISLRLGDALALLVYHNERHVVQAQRVRVSEFFPYFKTQL